MKLNQISKVYLIGIGGIGMSALARFFKSRSVEVMGYDRFETSLTRQLLTEGINVTYTDAVEEIPQSFKTPADDLLVIYTPSVPKTAAIHAFFLHQHFQLYKRSQVLGFISLNHSVLAVAGTHGKTTTSIMLAHLLKSAGIAVSAFLGGISVNYNTNFLNGDSEWVVVEADEYDRSFLTLFPKAAVITSMDADHLDIYGNIAAMNESYNLFAAQVNDNGLLLVHKGLPVSRQHTAYEAVFPDSELSDDTNAANQHIQARGTDFTPGQLSDVEVSQVHGSNIRIVKGEFIFDYADEISKIKDIVMQSPGLHNIENAVAALRLARYAGLDCSALKVGIESFKGVKRRFEYLVKTTDQIFIDDYAHHHEELKALIQTLKLLYPDQPLTFVFQPHLFSRTRDFYREIGQVLSKVDVLILLDIYPARELPVEGITSALILENSTAPVKYSMQKDELISYIELNRPSLLVTAGAGDIDGLVQPLAAILATERSSHAQN